MNLGFRASTLVKRLFPAPHLSDIAKAFTGWSPRLGSASPPTPSTTTRSKTSTSSQSTHLPWAHAQGTRTGAAWPVHTQAWSSHAGASSRDTAPVALPAPPDAEPSPHVPVTRHQSVLPVHPRLGHLSPLRSLSHRPGPLSRPPEWWPEPEFVSRPRVRPVRRRPHVPREARVFCCGVACPPVARRVRPV